MLSVNQELQDGRYRILKKLVQEDDYSCYEVFDNYLRTRVAIREIFSEQPKIYKNAITRQLEQILSIQHESFTKVYSYFFQDDQPFIVTEIIDSQNLRKTAELQEYHFPVSDVLLWSEQILQALSYLFSKIPPIIHHAITPEHLLLTENNRVRFQTSALIHTNKQDEVQKNVSNDRTLPYLPLESLWDTLDSASQKVILNSYEVESAEILELPIDERSNVYSVGATIYYLVTGKSPLNALERSIEILEGKKDPLINPLQLNSEISQPLAAFILKSLELKRESRFSSIESMQQSLKPMTDLVKKEKREAQNQIIREAAIKEVEQARQLLKQQKEVIGVTAQISQSQAKPLETKTPVAIIEQTNSATDAENLPNPQVQPQLIEVEEKLSNSKTFNLPVVPPTANTIAREPFQSEIIIKDEEPIFSSEIVERKKSFWLIPAFCGLVILIAVAIFGFTLLNNSKVDDTTHNPSQQNLQGKELSPPAEIVNPPSKEPESPKTVEKENSPPIESVPTVVKAEKETLKTDSPRNSPKKVIQPTQTVEKKPVPAKSDVPRKKEITVDDIIKDN